MRYAKPEVIVLESAANAIQSGTKSSPFNIEVIDQRPTLSAYEADE
jgi:hypothetical protein